MKARINLIKVISLTLEWWRQLSRRNQATDLQSKSMDWFLYDNGLCHWDKLTHRESKNPSQRKKKNYEKTYSRYRQHFCRTLKPHVLGILLFDPFFEDFSLFRFFLYQILRSFEKLHSLFQPNMSVTERMISTKWIAKINDNSQLLAVFFCFRDPRNPIIIYL